MDIKNKTHWISIIMKGENFLFQEGQSISDLFHRAGNNSSMANFCAGKKTSLFANSAAERKENNILVSVL